jgi:gamma-glutamyltranspeptidase / glutathione hydrolase
MIDFPMSRWYAEKTGLSSNGGMVVAKQEWAAQAGAKMLAEGGNAVDAACAAAWVMAVMEPYLNTIGGAGYMVYRQANGDAHAVNFSTRAPKNLTDTALSARSGPEFSGPMAAAVPSTVSGLTIASERFGNLPLAQVMDPAITIAEEGMPLDWTFVLNLVLNLTELRKQRWSREVFLVDGDPGVTHEANTLRQTDLANTLKQIAEHGADVFYRGPIGREIVEFVQGLGGVLDLGDLEDFSATVEEPLQARFRDYEVLTVPMPCPGLMTIQGMRILSQFDLANMGHNSPEALHVIAEAYRLAFADRDAYFGDPDFVDVPVETLLSDEYVAQRAREIDPEKAMSEAKPGNVGQAARTGTPGGGGTTHLCTVDSDGNMVSLTQTLIGGLTGLGVAGKTGVVMNCALQWFNYESGTANSAEPGKRPVSNMTPLIVERDGRAVLAVGAPGSRRITNAVSQVALNVLEYGMHPQRAISAPRIDLSLGHIVADDRIDAPVLDDLRRRGHTVDAFHEFINSGGPANSYRGGFARPNAIFIDEDGVRHGGDYQFAPGAVVAVPPDRSG